MTRGGASATADLVATHDGPAKALLNVGLIWWRATAATLQLALRVENRTFGGWEQAILNEEASFFSGVACCHGCALRQLGFRMKATHDLSRRADVVKIRAAEDGADRCSDAEVRSRGPPARSKFLWASTRGAPLRRSGAAQSATPLVAGAWDPSAYNELVGRAFLRCSEPRNLCGGCAATPHRQRGNASGVWYRWAEGKLEHASA